MGELHKEELKGLFREANSRSVVIKLLDTALGKFLPTTGETICYACVMNLQCVQSLENYCKIFLSVY